MDHGGHREAGSESERNAIEFSLCCSQVVGGLTSTFRSSLQSLSIGTVPGPCQPTSGVLSFGSRRRLCKPASVTSFLGFVE